MTAIAARRWVLGAAMVFTASGLAACATTGATSSAPTGADVAPDAQTVATLSASENSQFEQDRQAILAMAGKHRVTFDFRETVSFVEGYAPKEPYRTGGDEWVTVVKDSGDYISLQHILVVGEKGEYTVKHWRQDWAYEPATLLTFIGGNAWETREVADAERAGRWSQTVYQVDDSPRYGALGAWSHDNGLSEWTGDSAWRPLPRRDMTKRDDYHVVDAVNRHAITPEGWVHEQDNTKLVLGDDPHALVREIGVNTYARDASIDFSAAEEYWAKTAEYWSDVREQWSKLEQEAPRFRLTLKGEPEDLYMPLLDLAGEVNDGARTVDDAALAAQDVIEQYTTADLGELRARLRTN